MSKLNRSFESIILDHGIEDKIKDDVFGFAPNCTIKDLNSLKEIEKRLFTCI
jgi:hypothetical protein